MYFLASSLVTVNPCLLVFLYFKPLLHSTDFKPHAIEKQNRFLQTFKEVDNSQAMKRKRWFDGCTAKLSQAKLYFIKTRLNQLLANESRGHSSNTCMCKLYNFESQTASQINLMELDDGGVESLFITLTTGVLGYVSQNKQ